MFLQYVRTGKKILNRHPPKSQQQTYQLNHYTCTQTPAHNGWLLRLQAEKWQKGSEVVGRADVQSTRVLFNFNISNHLREHLYVTVQSDVSEKVRIGSWYHLFYYILLYV